MNDNQRRAARKSGNPAGYRCGGKVKGYADGGMVDRWGQKSTYVPRRPEPEKKRDKQNSEYREVKGVVRG